MNSNKMIRKYMKSKKICKIVIKLIKFCHNLSKIFNKLMIIKNLLKIIMK